MEKFRFLMFILSLCLLLSSCATVQDLPPDMVITPPDTEISTLDTISDEQSGAYRKIVAAEYIGGGRNGVFWNHLMFTSLAEVINLESGEVLSACSDPLCNHSGDGCAKRVLMGANDMLVSSSSDQNDLVLYISNDQVTIDAEQSVTQNHRVLRYQFYTGEVSVLAENLPWEPLYFGIDPVTDNLFFQQRLISESGETEVFLYILNGKSGKLDILPTPNMYPSAEYVVGDVVYFYDANSGGYFCFDLSQEELVMQEADSPDNYEDYVYYRENVMDVRVYVPDDLLPLYEEYGKEPYKVYTKYDMYRVKSGDESATPELVAKDILTGWAVGDYFLYYEFDPQYIASYFMDYAEDETSRVVYCFCFRLFLGGNTDNNFNFGKSKHICFLCFD